MALVEDVIEGWDAPHPNSHRRRRLTEWLVCPHIAEFVDLDDSQERIPGCFAYLVSKLIKEERAEVTQTYLLMFLSA